MTSYKQTILASPSFEGAIRARILHPSSSGPQLDDRTGEAPEDILIELAQNDSSFQTRLERVIADYIGNDDGIPPIDDEAIFARGCLEIVEQLALGGVHVSLRSWLDRYFNLLCSSNKMFSLAHAALRALAACQPQGLRIFGEYWRELWDRAPDDWLPMIFIGLRRHRPDLAAAKIPELIRRVDTLGYSPAPLLRGLLELAERDFCAWAVTAEQRDVRRVATELGLDFTDLRAGRISIAWPRARKRAAAMDNAPPIYAYSSGSTGKTERVFSEASRQLARNWAPQGLSD